MRVNGLKAVLLTIGLVAVVGFATNVFAGKGYGRGYGGPEGNDRGWDCPGYGSGSGLSDEESAKFDSQRKAFFDSTRELRRSIRQKNLELQSELAKAEIDGARARSIQKELSALRAQMDEKRLDQRMKMQEDYPDWPGGPGHRGRGMQGRGGRW